MFKNEVPHIVVHKIANNLQADTEEKICFFFHVKAE